MIVQTPIVFVIPGTGFRHSVPEWRGGGRTITGTRRSDAEWTAAACPFPHR